MFLGFVSISAVCLVLAYSGWESPDVNISSSTELISLELAYDTDRLGNPPITSLSLFTVVNLHQSPGYCDITKSPDDMSGARTSGQDWVIKPIQLESNSLPCGKYKPLLDLPGIVKVKMTSTEITDTALVLHRSKEEEEMCYEAYQDETDHHEDLVCSREEARVENDTGHHNLVVFVIILHLILFQCKHGLLGRLYSSLGTAFAMTSSNLKKLTDLEIELDLEYSELFEKIKFLKNQIDDKDRSIKQKATDLKNVRKQLIDNEKTSTTDLVKQLNEKMRLKCNRGENIKKMRPSWQDKIDIHKFGRPIGNSWVSRRRARLA